MTNRGAVVVWLLCLIQAGQAPPSDRVPAELATVEARAIERASDGALWVGVRDRGLARILSSGVTWADAANVPRGVAEIEEIAGTLWAVGLGGASLLGSGGWTLSTELGGLSPRVVFAVSPGAEPGVVWFGTSSGAVRRGPDGWRTVTVADGLPHAVVHDVVAERDGSVWLLCRTGLARWRDGQLEVFWEGTNFRAGLIGPDSRPWFGTSDGLFRWTGDDWDRELAGIALYPKLVTADGSVWAGSASDGLWRHRAGRWSRIPLPGADGAEVFDVAEGADGSIWVATASGVVRLGGL